MDTILSTGIKIDNEDVTTSSVIMRILNDDVWLYYPNWKDNDSIHFLKINLKTYKKELVNIYVPSISIKISTPFIKAFDINNNGLVILFTDRAFAYFKSTEKGYNFQFIEPLHNSFTSIRLLKDDQLLIYSNYNYHPKDNPDKTLLYVYDCKKHVMSYTGRPNFNAIEFSHFSPYHWLDVNSKNIVFSQTISYSLSFFDFKLVTRNQFAAADKNWVYADTSYIKGLEAVKPAISAKVFIDKLSPMEDSVSRVEAVYFLNDTKLLVRKIPANAKQQNRLRTYDILFLNTKTNTWERKYSDIKDIDPDPNVVLTKTNFPITSVFDEVTFSEGFYLKLLPRFMPFQFNKTHKEDMDNENKAMGTVVPELYLQIFKTDFR